MSGRVPGVSSVLRLRPEIKALVERGRMEEIRGYDPSPSLADVVLHYEYSTLLEHRGVLPPDVREKCEKELQEAEAKRVFIEPQELFERTYLGENMDDLIVKIFSALLGLSEAVRRDGTVTTLRSRIVVLPSLMGGGKTHLLITLLHLVELYNRLVYERKDLESFRDEVSRLDESLADRLEEMISKAERRRIKVAALDGTRKETTPDPNAPEPVLKASILLSRGVREVKAYGVRTLWGAIAHYLGAYDLLARRDEANSVPSVEEVRELFSEGPALIMVDEPLVYASRYGDREKLRDFFQVLASAVKEAGNSVLLISIPVPHESFAAGSLEGFAGELRDVLHRAQPGLEIIPPLKAPELVQVLKRRLLENSEEELENLGKEVAQLVISKGGEVVRSAVTSVYGSTSVFEDRFEESYPFSPSYLELLEDMVNQNIIQRTRDSIRLTIMALSSILRGEYRWLAGDFLFIAPHHLPLHDSSLRSHLANPNTTDYQIFMTMYSKDVEEAPEKTSRPGLAKVIASYVWLRSLLGRGVPEKAFLHFYPTLNDIVLAVYDPAVFSQLDLGAGAIGDALEELYSYSSYMIKLDSRYFMTQLLPIDELIEKRVGEISDIQALKRLYNLVEELFALVKRSGRKEVNIAEVFKSLHVIGPENGDVVPQELEKGEEPVLVAFTFTPEEEISAFLTRNNVVAVVPSMDIELEDPIYGRVKGEDLAKRLAKELEALETIDFDTLKKLYGEEFASGKRAQIDSRKREVRKKLSGLLKNQLYNRIYVGRPKWLIKRPIGSATTGNGNGACKAVEEILAQESYIPPGNAYTKSEILMLAKSLGKARSTENSGVELGGEMEIGEIWRWLLTTVDPPFKSVVVRFDGFLNGLKELFEELDIAVVYGDEFIWKRVYNERPSTAFDRGFWEDVENLERKLRISKKSMKVKPWTQVVDQFIEQLKREEGLKEENGVKKFVRIMVSYTDVFGKRVDEDLSKFLQRDGWRELAKKAMFWRMIEYPEYAFTLDIEEVLVSDKRVAKDKQVLAEPDQEILVKVGLDLMGYPFKVKITVTVNGRAIDTREVEGSSKRTIEFRYTPADPGEVEILIEGVGFDPKQFKTRKSLIVRVRGEVGERHTLDADGLRKLISDPNYSKVEVRIVEINKTARIVDIVRELWSSEVKARIREIHAEKLVLRGLKSEGTLLTISGSFKTFDEFRAFVETLSRVFKLESENLKLHFKELEEKDELEDLLAKMERSGVKSVKYHVEARRIMG